MFQISTNNKLLPTEEFERTKELAEAEKSKWSQGASDLYIVNLREQDLGEVEIKRWTIWLEYHQYVNDAKLFSSTLLN